VPGDDRSERSPSSHSLACRRETGEFTPRCLRRLFDRLTARLEQYQPAWSQAARVAGVFNVTRRPCSRETARVGAPLPAARLPSASFLFCLPLFRESRSLGPPRDPTIGFAGPLEIYSSRLDVPFAALTLAVSFSCVSGRREDDSESETCASIRRDKSRTA